MKNLILLCFIGLPLGLSAQISPEEAPVVQVIKDLFDAMRAGDSSAMRPLFDPSARLQSAYTNKEGKAVLHGGTVDKFIESIGTPHPQVYDEQIFSYRTEMDGRLATVWTDYTFYVGEKLSHCGVNAFHLFEGEEGWKITQITDTRRRKDCQEDPRRLLHTLMNQWHEAAAKADEDTFFGSMTEDAIYLGTEAGERWLRDELKQWSEKFFARDSAWDFTPSNRMIYFSPDRSIAWLEEDLATWMGPCRGSAVLALTQEGWKIKHYDLAIMVPNDKVEAFLKLMGEGEK